MISDSKMDDLLSKWKLIFFLISMWIGKTESLMNLAFGKQAYQTGVSENFTADKAVDGWSSPNPDHNTCAHPRSTLFEHAFWEVDLDTTAIIDHVTIYNTYLDSGNALRDVELYIGMQYDDYKLEGFHEGEVNAYYTFQLRKQVIGRWVRITRLPFLYEYIFYSFTLCEVQVYGYIIRGNLALGKQAYQTGVYEGFTADKAVDGWLSPYLHDNSCTHTPLVAEAFWEVDLGSTSIIDHVTIYNRNYTIHVEDYDRLRDVELYIGMQKDDYKLEGFHEGQVDAICTFQVRKQVKGRWVRITRSPSVTDYLTLCEVQVYGYIIRDFSLYPNLMGIGTVIQTSEAKSPIQCGYYCYKASSCSAANYHASKNQCDLLFLSSAIPSVDGVALIAYEYGLLEP